VIIVWTPKIYFFDATPVAPHVNETKGQNATGFDPYFKFFYQSFSVYGLTTTNFPAHIHLPPSSTVQMYAPAANPVMSME